MKILEVIPVFSPEFGGPVKVVKTISKELAKKHQVTVCTTSASSHTSDYCLYPYKWQTDGYEVLCFPRTLRATEFNISPSMGLFIKQSLSEYDIVHLHSWRQFQDMIVHYYAKKRNVPYVVQAHGSIPRMASMKTEKWLYDMFFGYRVLKDASTLISLNSRESSQYEGMGVPCEKIKIIPNAIDQQEYLHLPSKGSFKKKYSIEKQEKIILYLGRVHKSKGLHLLSKAFSYVAEKADNVRLVIVGPDDGYTGILLKQFSDLGISERVLLTGFVNKEDKMAALVDSEVLVTPEFSGFPVTFLEACLTGCPIITTFDDLDWIKNNVGLVVEKSTSALATAILRLVQDETLQTAYSLNCMRTIKDFDISTIGRKLELLYEEAIARHQQILIA